MNLPGDGEEGEESGMGLLSAIPTTEQNASDGPYRRVRSVSSCTGSFGVFYPGWRNQISLVQNPEKGKLPHDEYWTYLGSRTSTANGLLEVDAGVQWSTTYYRYNPYLKIGSTIVKDRTVGPKARVLCPKNWPIQFDTSYFGGIQMCYALQPTGKGSTPVIVLDGADLNWEEKTLLLAGANPVKVTSGMMKRAHSIAQGRKGGNYYRRTGSQVYNAAFSDGKLRNASGQWVSWVPWTAEGERLTHDQGAYPWPSSIVTWTIPSGQEYYTENSISIQL